MPSCMFSCTFSLLGYKLLRTDRVRPAGGVAIYMKSNIKTKFFCKSPNESEIEYMFVELYLIVITKIAPISGAYI